MHESNYVIRNFTGGLIPRTGRLRIVYWVWLLLGREDLKSWVYLLPSQIYMQSIQTMQLVHENTSHHRH